MFMAIFHGLTRKEIRWQVLTLLFVVSAQSVWAGGGWVPKPRKGYVQFGYSRKTADRVWDDKGVEAINLNANGNPTYHDFRYGYLNGEVGLFNRVSVTFLTTYLWGYEGRKNEILEANFGLSDAWFGANFRLKEGGWPMAARVTWRTPFFYDQPGPYVRHLYNTESFRVSQTRVVRDSVFKVINSPEWRGLLKNDLTFAYAVSHSFLNYRAWASLDFGVTFRQGSPADEVPVNFEAGYKLPLVTVKASFNYIRSLHNNSVSSLDDRFSTTSSFNDASILRGYFAVLVPVNGRFTAQVGYGQWLWGVGARQYKEPFGSLVYSFGGD